jgi:hypothetical protein
MMMAVCGVVVGDGADDEGGGDEEAHTDRSSKDLWMMSGGEKPFKTVCDSVCDVFNRNN